MTESLPLVMIMSKKVFLNEGKLYNEFVECCITDDDDRMRKSNPLLVSARYSRRVEGAMLRNKDCRETTFLL